MTKKDKDREQVGVHTPEMAVLGGISNVFRFLLAVGLIGLVWVVAMAVATYFSITSATGTFGQGLATNSLASLLSIAIAPILFSVLLHKSPWYFLVFAGVATVLIVMAANANGGLRDFLLNLGCGIWFLLAVDYYISRRFKAWVDKLEGEAKEMAKEIQLVL